MYRILTGDACDSLIFMQGGITESMTTVAVNQCSTVHQIIGRAGCLKGLSPGCMWARCLLYTSSAIVDPAACNRQVYIPWILVVHYSPDLRALVDSSTSLQSLRVKSLFCLSPVVPLRTESRAGFSNFLYVVRSQNGSDT